MKRTVFRYFSLLLLLLTIGVNAFGDTDSKGNKPESPAQNTEQPDASQVATSATDKHWALERSRVLSSQEITTGNSREQQISLSLYRKLQLANHKSEFSIREEHSIERFSALLGIRHIEGFYLFDLCKIVI
jgi:hypothetical protein